MSFNELKRYLYIMGIFQWKNSTRREKLIRTILAYFIFGIFVEYFVTTFWYMMIYANTFAEYAESMFFIECASLAISWHSMYLWQRREFSDLFEDLDAMIEKSKC